ncbi:MAG TPA: zf-HC2 domain-containing protein, partial [Ktedonobacteraceae bacterium]
MAKSDRDQHLTTEQLSALLDNKLSSAEQDACNAHLQSCQLCQHELASLQQTAALLRAMPKPALPRSFALSTGVTYLQDAPPRQVEATNTPPRRRWPHYMQRSLRAMSTIAAVIGFIFLLSGVLPLLMHGGAGLTTTTSSSVPSTNNATQPNAAATNSAATAGQAKPTSSDKLTPRQTPHAGKTPAPATASPAVHDRQHKQP